MSSNKTSLKYNFETKTIQLYILPEFYETAN